MNKKTLSILVSVMALGLAAVGVSRLVQYVNSASTSDTTSDTSSDESEEPVYHRVEAERYELLIPHEVNGLPVFGCLYTSDHSYEDAFLTGHFVSLSDTVSLNEDGAIISLKMYVDGALTVYATEWLMIEEGEYGRYVISETQVAGEPVAFSLEPIYEYVLV